MIKFFRKIQTSDRELDQVQSNVQQAFSEVLSNVLTDGTLIENVAVSTTPTRIGHKLTRAPNGWLVADNTADSRVWRTGWDSKTITLQASAATTIKIWVF